MVAQVNIVCGALIQLSTMNTRLSCKLSLLLWDHSQSTNQVNLSVNLHNNICVLIFYEYLPFPKGARDLMDWCVIWKVFVYRYLWFQYLRLVVLKRNYLTWYSLRTVNKNNIQFGLNKVLWSEMIRIRSVKTYAWKKKQAEKFCL